MNQTPTLLPAVTAATFEHDVLEASRERLVVVDFWAEWCGPCKAMAPVLEEALIQRGEAVKIVKVDVDREPRLSMLHGVRSIPTLAFFRDGRKVDELVGLQALDPLLQRIDRAATA
ncbi:thioredoxin [Actomonas aquatica]|uniref:Thioredoxin n=1 Tax=Actomonas aquatica TaxID=2866162 RepID=A0ABZ1C8N2_9BACT|nr:thioredoxin [Opitutus sp. WL0086]WRQ87828.1 thioredoxin [Opitutus sp. WL0086]